MRRSIILPLLLFIFVRCGDDRTPIPNYEVYVKTSYSEYQHLRTPLSHICYTYDNTYASNVKLGFGGVCVYRDMNGDLKACDMACPYENLRGVILNFNKMPYAICSECGSKYDLSYGSGVGIEGPAKDEKSCIMRFYQKIKDNHADEITVTN